MGTNFSCCNSQQLDSKFQVDEITKSGSTTKPTLAAKPFRTRKKKKKKLNLLELPIELLIPSLSRAYLIKRHFEAAWILKSFRLSHRLIFTPLPTKPEIEKIESTLAPYSVKSITSKNLRFIPSTELAEGGFYEGQWDIILQSQEGSGVMLYPDDSKFIGYFHDGKRNHQGRHIKMDGDIYEGEFNDNYMQGKGILYRNNGIVYTGDFEKNLESGYGTIEQFGKVIYVGSFLNGMKHGKGKLTLADGNVYEGEFKSNTMDGYGKYVWTDGKEYSGQWKINKPHGEGTYTWPDGRKYYGYYSDGLRHGYGEFTWPDGREYKGSWVKGKMHGEGFYAFDDETGTRQSLKSSWINGRREKWL
ncbi:hypothetical protein SteCoe_28230 [Stentor coeruleus]|uniref:MORN repeat-containing protein n=1 Tax=Stentor coeruleus TaxID=5963 RepID=A0A1R2B988_9CILI|nr:hypothetical protein SteCoe_28230 [Stentor coeruleus]